MTPIEQKNQKTFRQFFIQIRIWQDKGIKKLQRRQLGWQHAFQRETCRFYDKKISTNDPKKTKKLRTNKCRFDKILSILFSCLQ